MSNTFTDREVKLLASACQSFEGQPKLDLDKFSALSGLTKGSARNAWTALKKKMNADANGAGSSAISMPSTPATGKGGKGGKGTNKRPPPVVLPTGEQTDDEEDVESPSKKPRATKTKAKGKGKTNGKAVKEAVKEEDENQDQDDDDEVDGFVRVKEEITDEAII